MCKEGYCEIGTKELNAINTSKEQMENRGKESRRCAGICCAGGALDVDAEGMVRFESAGVSV